MVAKKKTTKAGTKKKTKTTSKKKKTSARKATTIKYKCDAGKCKAVPKVVHLGGKGSLVSLQAVNTDADIRFGIAGSPFTKSHFSIPAGTTEIATVVKAGTFAYTLTCSECGGLKLAGPPQMIVP